MIKEDYVSFEVAKLLEEKGFNEPCYTCYLNKELSHYDYLSTNFELIDNAFSAPTLQMACKWLREVHNIYIWVQPNSCKEGLHDAHVKDTWAGIGYKSYEEAVEVALKYCLEHLI